MAKSREHFALDWIKGELLETLNDARQALEAYVESDRDQTRMRACLTGLHQVHGTLVMLELAGVTLLADHLEQLAQKMLTGSVEDESAASQVLMQGILELPGHLEEIQAGSADSPKNVARLVNEIRAHLGQPPVDLGGRVSSIARDAPESALSRFENIDGAEKTRKIRAAYQQVLLSILKGEDVAGSVSMLGKVAQGLQRVCKDTPHELQWQAFGEFVASLAAHQGPLDSGSVKLLRRVDSEIRLLGQKGIGSLKEPVSVDLIEQLLEAAAERKHRSEITERIRGELEGSEAEEQAVTPTGRQALSSAAAALREELLLVKDQLDLIVRSGRQSVDQLVNLVAPLKQIGSTLSLLGFESSKTIVADQIDTLNQFGEGGEVDQGALMSIASALLQVDENLASFAQGGKNEAEKIVDEAERAVTVEARQGLDQIKQDIVDFISSEWDPRHLKETPGRIAGICGALDMIPLARASRLLASCGHYIASTLSEGQKGGWQEMDLFADAISGIDYYLERIGEETSFGVDDVLDLVERSLTELGVDLSVPLPRLAPAAEAADADEVITAEPAREPIVEPAAASAELTESMPGDIEEEEEEEPKLEMDDDPGFDLDSTGFEDLGAVAATPAAEIEAGKPAPAAEPQQASASKAAGTRAVDPSLVDTFESDAEIVEIFVEEVDEVLGAIDEWLPIWRDDLKHEDALTEVRRSFHTLKGSGRIVGANVIGELAWSVENMLNRLIDGTVEPTQQFVAVVDQARQLAPELKEAFELKRTPDMGRVGAVMEQADVLASGGTLDEASSVAAPEAEDSALQIFLAEAALHLKALRDAVTPEGVQLTEASVRALHTLAGSAGMAEFSVIEELARPTYELASALRGASDRTVDGEAADYFRRAIQALGEALRAVVAGAEPEDPVQLIAEADHLIVAATEQAAAGESPSRVALMELDGLSQVMGADEFLDNWKNGAMDLAYGETLVEALDDIGDAASENDAQPIADLARAFSAALVRLADGRLDDGAYRTLAEGHGRLLDLFDALAAEQSFDGVDDVVAALDTLDAGLEAEEEQPRVPDERGATKDNIVAFPADERDEDAAARDDAAAHSGAMGDPESDLQVAPPPVTVEEDEAGGIEIPAAEVADQASVSAAVAELLPEEVDEEIIEVFFEEAAEILEGLEENIHQWSSEPDNRLYLEHLLRGLHTLKGGARLSGLTKLGDATHQLESFLIDVQNAAVAPDDGFFDDLHGRYDEITGLLVVIKKALAGEAVTAAELAGGVMPEGAPETPERAPSRPAGSAARAEAGSPPDRRDTPRNVAPTPTVSPRAEPEKAKRAARTEEADETQEAAVPEPKGNQEIVRVGSGLLEELVNLAGESSIVRARVEQGMSDFTSALEEMETTIERLREQLRRLEIETEAQILFRSDRPDGPSYANFDPLEMDRYSQLQQLSRGLSESASDMLDLKETLLFKARESETLLLQQARINTELQEGLMRTRMVPFSRLLPRLRRIVRQVSSELGKEVEFHAYNAEGELDRSLLERMVPPLEHMLRNAIDHGIESAELRKNFGKPNAGRIDLRLSREGGDVVIEISDDGAGIDVESVRAKAVERGLMGESAELTDEEITQFVLAPGFSTAKSVTQISGRGVGLDVVHSEVKQLGGSIQISSRPGQGTRFIVRVPFTVSVNRALMVSVGDDFYAVPLNNIEGIVLLSPEELERLYAPDGNTFEYAGIPYRVRYLGHYLGREFRSSNQQSSVPVVLVRSGDHAVAVHVDGVQGSREIVVKSLGPQFAGVGGISGATILGDGNVVVILDLLALIRAHSGEGLVSGKRPLTGAARTRCVMVVDDSVTVRKVTSRLLERQGMDVIVAKDGVEAVALLQERRPDVMLLDIEMPRMDGFEVARQVRHDERLADLPIVMISSRTGEKHQEHAAELGVNSFLGKPFQENELLSTIDRLVD